MPASDASGRSPPSIAASDDPVVEQPTAPPPPGPTEGACHSSDRIATHRRSISAVIGYSSLSIMFLSAARSINAWASGSIQVVTKVARFWVALPSSESSPVISRRTISAGDGPSGIRSRGTSPPAPSSVNRGSVAMTASLIAWGWRAMGPFYSEPFGDGRSFTAGSPDGPRRTGPRARCSPESDTGQPDGGVALQTLEPAGQ